jgi:hypothetical protein
VSVALDRNAQCLEIFEVPSQHGFSFAFRGSSDRSVTLPDGVAGLTEETTGPL